MTLRFYNTLTKNTEPLTPLKEGVVTIYSCGPTVYDNAHIGNLSSFIVADVLRRTVSSNEINVTHVMNFTDVDDKTIRRSKQDYPQLDIREALTKLTELYGRLFLDDMQAVGNDTNALTFIKAADDATIEGMRRLIKELFDGGFAYITDDGVYFSIEAYRKSGKTYGQLIELSEENTSSQRIQNDEYDKESVHDFALWKVQKPDEPTWELTLDGRDLTGRPGWHLECSVMSSMTIGQPFDIHTGGIDLVFPHHENEIAQSTAGRDDPTYAQTFIHNEHILVDGKKMSKSLGNFYTLKDLIIKGVDPLAFRLLVLQSHYRKQTNFSFDNIEAAHNRLKNWKNIAVLRHQTHDTLQSDDEKNKNEQTVSLLASSRALINTLSNDLDTPAALTIIDEAFAKLDGKDLTEIHQYGLSQLLDTIDSLLGLQLVASTPDISDEAKRTILERQQARKNNNWDMSDELRDKLSLAGIGVKDTAHGTVWFYL